MTMFAAVEGLCKKRDARFCAGSIQTAPKELRIAKGSRDGGSKGLSGGSTDAFGKVVRPAVAPPASLRFAGVLIVAEEMVANR